jgi:hypothetical protein
MRAGLSFSFALEVLPSRQLMPAVTYDSESRVKRAN